ncbi:MAG: carboxypeptidase regulatory-like domain-containing protein [Isosphaeraceae bacterium]
MSDSPYLRPPDIPVRTLAAHLAVVVLALVGLAGELPARGQAQTADLSGRVVDKAGAGVSGVKVWAIGGDWETPETVATATTDDRGRFVLPRAWGNADAQGPRFLSALARSHDGRIGWERTRFRGATGEDELKIVLSPVGQARGWLNDHEGRPIAGAEITPVLISRQSEDHPGQDSIRLSPEFATLLRTKTATDGSFAITGISTGGMVEATIATRGFGAPRIYWDISKPVTIVLDSRLGQIDGRLKPPDARGLAGKVSVTLRSKPPPEDRASGPFQVLYSQTVPAGTDGLFRFDDVPPARYEIVANFGQDSPFAVRGAHDVEVGPQAVAKVEIPLERLLTVTGRVLDAQTGKGIAGIGLRSSMIDSHNYLQIIGQAQTDALGRYTIGARPGTIQVQPNAVPKSYLGLWSSECPRLEVTADRTWPDLKLARATELDGVVVDAAGQPVVGAEVLVTTPDPRGFFSGRAPTWTGPGGTFHLEQLDPDDTLPLRARTKEATTDGTIVVRPRTVAGKLTLTIDPKFAFRVRGLVTDRSGKQIAGAKVQLWWTRNFVSARPDAMGKGIGSVLESDTTAEAGWFVFRDLWPGDRYKVVVQAAGWSKAESPEVTGRAGETHDFGTFVLTQLEGHLAGRVAGADGRPIAGATVFNRGDGPRPVETLTDDQGRFGLDSLFPGTKYAFVRKDGYRFTGMKANGDDDDLAVTLLRTTEPPPAWKPEVTASFEDQRAFARRILIRLWDKFGKNADRNGAFHCILDMARIDPDLAFQWSADHGHRYDGRIRQAAAEMLADLDGQEALGMLTPAAPSESQYTFQRLADQFAPTDPEKAMLFADEAVVRARALSQPNRAAALARAGTVLVRLGRAEAGRKLIEEAAQAANRLGTELMEGYTRGVVAKALTPFDANRALALLEPIHGNDRYLAFVAAALAEKDPARAVTLADAMAGNGPYPDRARTEIASRIGADRPDEAVRIIEGMKSFAADYMRAEAFAWLAIAIAPRDRPRAFALIDRALASPVDRPRLYESWINSGGGTASAAHMAAAARQVGYPDMDSVIMRVMTTRPSLSGPRVFDPGMQIRSATMAAIPLALVDPGAARVLLEQLEARSGLRPDKLADVAGRDWLRAWALVDLKKAETFFEAQLTAIERTKDVKLDHAGFFRMTEILALPPHRRALEVFHMDGTGRPMLPY